MYVYDDRLGGEIDWNSSLRGSDNVYGESIYTNRAEIIGMYQWPMGERIFSQFSYNWHEQDSWYGNTPYRATRSDEHTSELKSLMRISYAVFCLKKNKPTTQY